MADYKFYIIPITKSDSTYTPGNKVDIEDYYVSGVDAEVRYKSSTGMEAYGKPRPYVENYAEADMASVEIPSSDPRDQTDIVLNLYFMYSGASSAEKATQIEQTSILYHNFIDNYIAGKYVLYYDTARKRKALLYQSDKIDPTTDTLKGIIYKDVALKFKNVFGRTFSLSDTTIEKAIGLATNLTE